MGSASGSNKVLKDGKIVVLLQGRYAGKKAVILKTMDDNTKERPYGHCVVVGVAKTPLPITRAMCKPTPKKLCWVHAHTFHIFPLQRPLDMMRDSIPLSDRALNALRTGRDLLGARRERSWEPRDLIWRLW